MRRDCEPHRAGVVLGLGITSVVLCALVCPVPLAFPVGLVAWIMGHRDLKKMANKLMDPQGRSSTQGGYVCGIIGTSIGGIGVLFVLVMMLFWIIGAMASPGNAPAKYRRHSGSRNDGWYTPAPPLRFQDYFPLHR